jgi:putative transposase
MPRRMMAGAGGLVLHVLNRSVRRATLFASDEDYLAFERVFREALDRIPTRLLAYCVMPNHWHLVVWPLADELPKLMHWLTLTHAKRWHAARGTRSTGHVYQNRYRVIPVQDGVHMIRLIRYVERNALRAGLVRRAEDWRWGSLWARCQNRNVVPMAAWPISQPLSWVDIVNQPQTSSEVQAIRKSLIGGHPFGDEGWRQMADAQLGRCRRKPGRPRNSNRV